MESVQQCKTKVHFLLGNNNNNNINNNNNHINNKEKDLTTNGNGGGSLGSSTDKESLTPSPPARSNDDVKSEPMELVCGVGQQDGDHSNDSDGDMDLNHSVNDVKNSLR